MTPSKWVEMQRRLGPSRPISGGRTQIQRYRWRVNGAVYRDFLEEIGLYPFKRYRLGVDVRTPEDMEICRYSSLPRKPHDGTLAGIFKSVYGDMEYLLPDSSALLRSVRLAKTERPLGESLQHAPAVK